MLLDCEFTMNLCETNNFNLIIFSDHLKIYYNRHIANIYRLFSNYLNQFETECNYCLARSIAQTRHIIFLMNLGRGESVWDDITHRYPEKVADRSNGDESANSYEFYKEDVKALVEAGVHFYRFSISWSRGN